MCVSPKKIRYARPADAVPEARFTASAVSFWVPFWHGFSWHVMSIWVWLSVLFRFFLYEFLNWWNLDCCNTLHAKNTFRYQTIGILMFSLWNATQQQRFGGEQPQNSNANWFSKIFNGFGRSWQFLEDTFYHLYVHGFDCLSTFSTANLPPATYIFTDFVLVATTSDVILNNSLSGGLRGGRGVPKGPILKCGISKIFKEGN